MASGRVVLLLAALLGVARTACPFGGQGTPPESHPSPARRLRRLRAYAEAVAQLDLDAVKEDLTQLLTNSQSFWPADFGHYGPLFIRLAWHCAGSYRTSDGRGGCEGGRQRFEPERSWADNTNLDKARRLLLPIKARYGAALSWGDLIILAGTTAIEAMGGPVLGFCAGRMDDEDGSASLELGPSAAQEALHPCRVNGTCSGSLGSTMVGLIYLNPEGPLGQPDPAGSARDVRDAFGRMAMNDSETVALIGGGHTFGKAHGPCPDGAGPSPLEDPWHPWPGRCGDGRGAHVYTSGFEFQWTPVPTQWDNAYFQALRDYQWEPFAGPGGHIQWRVKDGAGELPWLGMLTSDVALMQDENYTRLVRSWAEDPAAFDHAFAHAWYKLVTRDMGPVTRCVGKYVPPAQAFQYPLPPPPAQLADFAAVRSSIQQVLRTPRDDVLPADRYDGVPYHGALLLHLAWRCASTFRETDWLGGCNGARLRFSPERDWPASAALDKALLLLTPIKEEHGAALSWADLIVLAGNTAIEDAGGKAMDFCGGRTDAEDGRGSELLSDRWSGSNTDAEVLRSAMRTMGLSARELTVLVGGGHSLGRMHADRSGFVGSWTETPTTLDNSFFRNLVSEEWTEFSGGKQYKARDKDLYMLPSDVLLNVDPEFSAIAQDYASDNERFLADFAAAWTRLMNADRFDGPAGNLCDRVPEDSSGRGFVLLP